MPDQQNAAELPMEDEVCDEYRDLCIDDGLYAEWDDAIAVVRRTLRALRRMPVEQRMEAMGMVAVGTYGPPELLTTTYTEPLPNGAVRRCRDCNGRGYTNEHDPSCRGDERRCQGLCPVEAPCRTCQASGYEVHRDEPVEDDDCPF